MVVGACCRIDQIMTTNRNSAQTPLILVTGAPRSGTTPIGHILSLSAGAYSLYEPMGPTGDVRFQERFPIPGEPSLSLQQFDAFLHDLVDLNLHLKPKRRIAYAKLPIHKRLLRNAIGSRSHISVWRARYSFGRRTIIWKDPHAALAAAQAAHAGVRVVTCLRSPWAHAASFKRLGWISPIGEIYSRYRSVHGPIETIDQELVRIGSHDPSPAQSATLLWHLIYTAISPVIFGAHAAGIARGEATHRNNAVLISASALELDELSLYEALFRVLGLAFDGRPRRALTQRIHTASGRGGRQNVVHDWSRTVASTNDSWRNILDPDEAACAKRINQSLYESLESVALMGNSSHASSRNPSHRS